MRVVFILVLSLLFTAVGVRHASANPVVLKIQERDIYINMGHESGLAVDSLVTLQHVIEATHPVTGNRVRDTFPLGLMRVITVGPKTAVVRASSKLFHRVQVGDEVSLASDPIEHVDPWTVPRQSIVVGPAQDAKGHWKREVKRAESQVAAEREVHGVWQATLGQPLSNRVQLWRNYLERNPESRYQAPVQRTLRELEARIASEEKIADVSPEERAANAALRRLSVLTNRHFEEDSVFHDAPHRGYAGEAVPLALLVPYPRRILKSWLYVRTMGEESYEVQPMGKDGDGYLRAVVAGAQVVAPGIEYFVEALEVGTDDPRPILGNSARPKRVAVDASARETPPDREGHSRVTLFTDYVDFDGPSTSYDQYIHAEVDFMYRFFQPIYSLRLGFGTISGIGGPKDVIDLGQDCMLDGEYRCRRVGYNYAFTELEERFSDIFAVMLRVQWGSAYQDRAPMEGVGREFFDAFGVRGRIRLGRERASNLVLGASTTQRLGNMYEGAFTWDVIPKFPVVLAVQVTDQPVLEDFGVRLISDVGWRYVDWVYPSLRIAYQARDIDHAGLSAGVAANFDW